MNTLKIKLKLNMGDWKSHREKCEIKNSNWISVKENNIFQRRQSISEEKNFRWDEWKQKTVEEHSKNYELEEVKRLKNKNFKFSRQLDESETVIVALLLFKII